MSSMMGSQCLIVNDVAASSLMFDNFLSYVNVSETTNVADLLIYIRFVSYSISDHTLLHYAYAQSMLFMQVCLCVCVWISWSTINTFPKMHVPPQRVYLNMRASA